MWSVDYPPIHARFRPMQTIDSQLTLYSLLIIERSFAIKNDHSQDNFENNWNPQCNQPTHAQIRIII